MAKTKEHTSAAIVMSAIAKRAKPLQSKLVQLTEIKTADDYATAALLISNLKQLSKQAAEERDKIATPLKQAMAALDEHFKPFMSAVQQSEIATKKLMTEFLELQQHHKQQLQEDFDKGKIKKLETLVTKQAALTDLDNSNATVRKVKTVKIIDAAKIPRQYLTVDLAAVKEALIAGKKVSGAELVIINSIAI